MPGDHDDPPTTPGIDAPIAAREAEAMLRSMDAGVSIATTPAPLDYADMAALLSTVPVLAVEPDDLCEFKLDDAARELLACIDGQRSVGEIAARVERPNVLGALRDLERRRIVSLVSPR